MYGRWHEETLKHLGLSYSQQAIAHCISDGRETHAATYQKYTACLSDVPSMRLVMPEAVKSWDIKGLTSTMPAQALVTPREGYGMRHSPIVPEQWGNVCTIA